MDHAFAVVDVETTGLSPARDRVVEVACVLIDGDRISGQWQSLVNPGIPVPAFASSIHGIYDGDVAGAPVLDQVLAQLRPMVAGRLITAHNARFDVSFLPVNFAQNGLCTMRLAQLLVPNAPNFKNQTLRKYLRLDRYLAHAPAHRALGDAQVTAQLLLALRRRANSAAAWGTAVRQALVVPGLRVTAA